VQGEIDPAWLDAPEAAAPRDIPAVYPSAAPELPAPSGAIRTPASGIFLGTLLLEVAADALGFVAGAPDLTWVMAGIIVLQMIAAVFVFIDRNRGRLASPVHKVAIAKLILLTLMFYINSGINAVNRTTRVPLVPANQVTRGFDLAVSIGLLIAGLAISWRPSEERPPSLLGN